MSDDATPSRPRLVLELREDELAVRIFEAMAGDDRLIAASPALALAGMRPEHRAAVTRASRAAIRYFEERLQESRAATAGRDPQSRSS